jgi:hypothetical protein
METVLTVGLWLFLVGPIALSVRLWSLSETGRARIAAVAFGFSSLWIFVGTASPEFLPAPYSAAMYLLAAANVCLCVAGLALSRRSSAAGLAVSRISDLTVAC